MLAWAPVMPFVCMLQAGSSGSPARASTSGWCRCATGCVVQPPDKGMNKRDAATLGCAIKKVPCFPCRCSTCPPAASCGQGTCHTPPTEAAICDRHLGSTGQEKRVEVRTQGIVVYRLSCGTRCNRSITVIRRIYRHSITTGGPCQGDGPTKTKHFVDSLARVNQVGAATQHFRCQQVTTHLLL